MLRPLLVALALSFVPMTAHAIFVPRLVLQAPKLALPHSQVTILDVALDDGGGVDPARAKMTVCLVSGGATGIVFGLVMALGFESKLSDAPQVIGVIAILTGAAVFLLGSYSCVTADNSPHDAMPTEMYARDLGAPKRERLGTDLVLLATRF